MRLISWLLAAILGVLLLGSTGCKKASENSVNAGPPKPTFSSGVCAVCGKQSTTLSDFQVPSGKKIKVCGPDCAAKIMADPKKFGGAPVMLSGSGSKTTSSAAPAPTKAAATAAPQPMKAVGPPPGAPPPGGKNLPPITKR